MNNKLLSLCMLNSCAYACVASENKAYHSAAILESVGNEGFVFAGSKTELF